VSIDTMQESATNLRVKRQFFTIPQIVLYAFGIGLSLLLTSQLHHLGFLMVAPVFIILALPIGKRGRMLIVSPIFMMRRYQLARRHNVVSRMTPDSAPVNGKVPKDGFREAFHGGVPYTTADGKSTDVLPVLMDGAKQRGALIVTADGLRVGAGGDEETRRVHMGMINDGIRDTINSYPGNMSIASLQVKRPGDVHTAWTYVTEEMADAVRDAPKGDPDEATRQYSLDQAWSGVFSDTRRLWVVSTELGSLRGKVNETLFAPAGKKLPTSSQVYDHPLFRAAENLLNTLQGAQAESPEIADAAGQALMVGECFTTHPEDLESYYRGEQSDLTALRLQGAIDLSESMSARRGPMPFSASVGHDWLLTGRTYHRILHILGGRGETLPLGLADIFVAEAEYPVIFSTVSNSIPGSWERYKAEEKARVEEIRLETRTQGYASVPERYKQGLEDAANARDRIFRSGAPPVDITNGVIVSAVSLADLAVFESAARHQLNRMRVNVETITGPEEQVDWFLYLLGIKRL